MVWLWLPMDIMAHMLHVWNMYQHLPQNSSLNVGKYTYIYHTWSIWVGYEDYNYWMS